MPGSKRKRTVSKKKKATARAKRPRAVAPARPSAAFDVIVMAASAGSDLDLALVLRSLPRDFAVPILIMQHLPPGQAKATPAYTQKAVLESRWLESESQLAAGQVLICPGRTFVELLPDGTFKLAPCERGAVDRPIDRLLNSAARSFGPRALGVVFSGMLDDGANGARALRAAGGIVIVQSVDTAEYPSMPRAVIQAGAVDVVAAPYALASLLEELAAGGSLPPAPTESSALQDLFGGAGEARAILRRVDWGKTPLGPVLAWTESLRAAVRNVLGSGLPTMLLWGPDFVEIFNDAAMPGIAAKASQAGLPARVIWAEAWSTFEPIFHGVMTTGKAHVHHDQPFTNLRNGYPEETYFSFTYDPVVDSDGTILGMRTTFFETTDRVLAHRRLRSLRDLATISSADSFPLLLEAAGKALRENPLDIPFVLFYLFDESRRRLNLASASGFDVDSPGAPQMIELRGASSIWPVAEVIQTGRGITVHGLAERLPPPNTGSWTEPIHSAMVLPLRKGNDATIAGIAVLGLSPRLRTDANYPDFLTTIAQHTSTALGDSAARQLERERSERLAEIDRAKVEFFANVSHEFRTPLTLLLAPLEQLLDELRDAGGASIQLPATLVDDVQTAARNGRRLLTLVNHLLDFSQIEGRRVPAHMEAVDLGTLTRDIASAFRSSIESAGLRFRVESDPRLPPVSVDREMWEKVVSNLLSNAFKFTFEGEISLALRALSLHAELTVTDTGIGIPAAQVPHVFKRFHRVPGARGRTVEGSGIGLALVEDLVQRMGGQVRVRSVEGRGTSFTVWLPFKSVRSGVNPGSELPRPAARPLALEHVEAVSRWIANAEDAPAEVLADVFHARPSGAAASRGRILVADDNADLRAYLKRLLEGDWQVELVADGESAWKALSQRRPDLILADVAMPGCDGFELLRRIRELPELRSLPFVLLTARAGEEAAIEGLRAGADDYIAKPFSPRELAVRVQAVVERARAEQVLRESEEKYRTLFDSIDEGVSILEVERDADGRVRDLLCLQANDSFARHTGLQDVVGKRTSELVPNLGRPVYDLVQAVADSGEPARSDFYVPDLDRWFDVIYQRVGGPGSPYVASVLKDITERKLQGERQAYLLKLSDALRPLRDPLEVQAVAADLLGAQLKVNQSHYGEVVGDHVQIRHSYGDGLPPMTGKFRHRDFGERLVEGYRSGRIQVSRDTATDPTISEAERTVLASAHIGAYIAMPLVKGGDWISTLAVHSIEPRNWRQREIDLVQETAERTWAAVERARAETALRRNEARMRRQNEAFQMLVNGRPIEQALEIIGRMVVEETSGEARTAFYLADSAGAHLHPVWGAGNMPDAYLSKVDGFAIGKDSLACGLAVPTGRAILTRDVFEEPLWKPWTHLAQEFDYRGCWSFPIKTKDNLAVGTFAMYFRTPREPTSHDLALADVVTQTAAVIIASRTAFVHGSAS